MRLILLRPEVAARSCADCQQYLFHDHGPDKFGDVVTRGGRPQPRPKGVPTPCAACPKIAPGDPPRPESAQDLSEASAQAYQHYLECKAVGAFPADPIVRRNAAVIKAAEDHAGRVHQTRTGLMVLGQMFKG